mgnify:CR=1 FL=1
MINATCHDLQSGHSVHGCKLLQKLGRGGSGEVWLAENLDGEFIALKFCLSDEARNRGCFAKGPIYIDYCENAWP